MKTILAAILATLSLGTAQAADYVMLTSANREITIDPTSFVEVVGFAAEVPDSTFVRFYTGPEEDDLAVNMPLGKVARGSLLTGMEKVRFGSLSGKGYPFVTFKITPAAEMNPVVPATVLVLPENSTGDYDVVIEASDDLVSWLPFFSQTVNSQTAKKFFRTRVVRSQEPAP